MLIVVGLLMFAFVAYQLWGTGIYTAQAQNRLDDEFARLAVPVTSVAPSASPTATTIQTTTAATPITAPATVTVEPSATTTSPPASAPEPIDPASPVPVPYPFEAPAEGDALVKIEIPRIDVSYVVVEGVGLGDLAKGPGHFPESVLPGQLGNSAIAGHRTTHGAPFSDVDELRPGDEIVITYPTVGDSSPRFVYRVTGTEIVSPSDYADVVPTTDPTRATLVLASCHPKRTSSQRIIVFAELVDSSSSPVFAATSLPTANPATTIPGDDEPDDPAPTAPTTQVDSVPSGAPVTVPTPGSSPSLGGAGSGAAAGRAPSASVDAFSAGWFDDTAAWPPIILWGLALAAITLGGYLLARRYRRIWLGALVSSVPFVVVLYFWFENVNRMLPPGL